MWCLLIQSCDFNTTCFLIIVYVWYHFCRGYKKYVSTLSRSCFCYRGGYGRNTLYASNQTHLFMIFSFKLCLTAAKVVIYPKSRDWCYRKLIFYFYCFIKDLRLWLFPPWIPSCYLWYLILMVTQITLRWCQGKTDFF